MESAHPSLTLAIALAVGVLCQSLARQLRIPGIVILLLAGVALGRDGLNWVRPADLGEGMFALVHLAVAIILFEGGLNLEISRLRRSQAAIRRLVSIGALVTLIGGALATRFVLHWDWSLAALFGSLVVVTGPTVVGPLVSELRLRARVATVLEAEGVLIDPIGALLAVLVLQLVLAPDPSALASGALGLIYRIGLGGVAGAVGGVLLALLLRTSWVPEGLRNISALAAILVMFEGCQVVADQSGLLAVTIAGVVLGNMRTRVDRDLREFKDQLSILLIGLLFVLLAADVGLRDLRALGWPGLIVVGLLIAVVRPLTVFASTLGTDLPVRERILISWVGPRGIVAAAVASITAVALGEHNMQGGTELRALVFLTIMGTVVSAGLGARPLASLLGVRLPGRDTVAILGAEGLGIALARELTESDTPVVLLDSNPQNCRNAEEAGLSVVFGNALEERIMQRARFELVGTAIGMTANETLNGMFANRARDLFSVPRRYVALRGGGGVTPQMLEKQESKQLFETLHDVERWDVRFRHGEVQIEKFKREPGDPTKIQDLACGETLLVLTLQRGSRVLLVSTDLQAQAGDVATIAIYAAEHEQAEAHLRAQGWSAA